MSETASPVEVRSALTEALQLDLVGPLNQLGNPIEVLPQAPSRWYLTGFLVPTDCPEDQKSDPTSTDELDQSAEPIGVDDDSTPDSAAARKSYFSSSMGVSVLIPEDLSDLDAVVNYGEYIRLEDEGPGSGRNWQRIPKEEIVKLGLSDKQKDRGIAKVPNSRGLELVWSLRKVPEAKLRNALPKGTRSLSVFLVNRRHPGDDEHRDEGFVFQVEMQLQSNLPFVPRPNLHSLEKHDWDERVADLQYRDAFEFSVGHNVATSPVVNDGTCKTIKTCWIPSAEVEKVSPPGEIPGVTLQMEALALLKDGNDAKQQLGNLITKYEEWIKQQEPSLKGLSKHRIETGSELLRSAGIAAKRIQSGIEMLNDPDCLEAFRIANRTMAAQGRRRLSLQLGKRPEEIIPAWRPFQLAFVLMNLKSIAQPTDSERELVDLLFFPTGGGKTEAYLGIAAFTLVYRRLQNPGISSAGLSVLMRYTLRLLTLDQLGRAAALICALELERQKDVEKLGEWPFEIGLWVGQAATPNRMGSKGDGDPYSARSKTIAYKINDSKPSPIPLEECPWCGTKFKPQSFQLLPNPDHPTDLRVKCANRHCEFSRDNHLPVLSVDEPLYRRLPCFVISTVDKFAAMPWTGEVGGFFGKVQRYDSNGFYGPCESGVGSHLPNGKLRPPDLVIQDELHLISGPLGTMVGLYETAIDALSTTEMDGKKVRPKIIASTATVRRAKSQIKALFNRAEVDVFPPPGPDVRDSFFAKTLPATVKNARQYLGIAAQGRSPKVIMLRVYLALLGAGQKQFEENGGAKNASNPADPYMTLLGYFNSLRELGGARRLIEDEVRTQLMGRGSRRRVGESEGLFKNRKITYEPVELTSRVSTDKVSDAKRKLDKKFIEKEHVDVAIATNMISVGLDITRLGLLVCFGQPKTSSEYIQATSRVGRDEDRPGLVVTILNVHRPRDRSHYERFQAYHQSFYRSVEATSVTPFSPRAMDRGLAGTLVSLARQGNETMTPPRGAFEVLNEFANLSFVVDEISKRAQEAHREPSSAEAIELAQKVKDQCKDLFDTWSRIAKEQQDAGGSLQYQVEVGGAQRLLYEFLNPDLARLPPHHKAFRANRSMRDVEPSVNLWLKTLDGIDIEAEDDQ